MFRVWVAVWPCAEVAVTVIAQRPAVSSRGGNAKEPSSATFIVEAVFGSALAPGAGAGDARAGFGFAAGAPGAVPRNVAVTATVSALVVVPSTAIAPLP